MNDLSSATTLSEATTHVGVSLYRRSASLQIRVDVENHFAISCLFSKLYLDSLFTLAVVLATPDMREPSLLIDTHLITEEDSWGRNQPLFLAADTGVTS